ncbi:MAG: pyridoxal-phosphate dependent enzyme [Acidisphaera sp.]|nr:pyridoxal-phosphate dependent enzyme [Acidisphaera sp.]
MPPPTARLELNRQRQADPAAVAALVTRAALRAAARAIADWAEYRPTPTRPLPGLAARLGVAEVAVKLEGERFAVGSFKALGPPYALQRELRRRGGAPNGWTAVAATSGNHGRALAWGAARLGARACIFMSAHVSPGRAEAIGRFGADVVRVPGDFDAASQAAAEAGRRPRHLLIGDLPVQGRMDIARDTICGYAVLGQEILAQCGEPPTHVFVAAGNGSLAAAVCARLRLEPGLRQPCICTVEPTASDAIRRSLAEGAAVSLPDGASVMDGLVVRAPAAAAWPILRCGLDAALAIPDAAALLALRGAASGAWGDAPLAIGETGIAAVAGLLQAAGDPMMARALGVGPTSRLLAIACEGVTDPDVLARLLHEAERAMA